MEFEFDPEKSAANKKKHGISFNEAMRLWEDTDCITIPLMTTVESRLIVIGKISERHWSAIVTFRGAKTRIISVRRSRKEEANSYEDNKR